MDSKPTTEVNGAEGTNLCLEQSNTYNLPDDFYGVINNAKPRLLPMLRAEYNGTFGEPLPAEKHNDLEWLIKKTERLDMCMQIYRAATEELNKQQEQFKKNFDHIPPADKNDLIWLQRENDMAVSYWINKYEYLHQTNFKYKNKADYTNVQKRK